MGHRINNTIDRGIEVGTTGLGLLAGLSAVSPEAGLLTQLVSTAVGGVIGYGTGRTLTHRS